ncbi:adhesion G protein-coupled receptor F5-like isoform X2 [Hemibagrus wyckioides]|uniref:adhesion G protein-coupled receptor F5-like isoform X2 n=1 Tax=Hemibagrus wyckioides TaxID=337641 RepID=UPI00266D8C18|nr:adhesion G protein-coupled receptor F5-like isoform X2 [Hemibagrus wyckioides]
MPTKGRASKLFLRCVAMLLIHICVMNSQKLPQVSDTLEEYSKKMFYLDHIRQKRDVLTTTTTTTATTTTAAKTTNSTTIAPSNRNSTTSNSTTTNSTTANSTTTNSTTTNSTTANSTTTNSTTANSTTTNSTTTNSTTKAPSTTKSTTTTSSNRNTTTKTPSTTKSTTTTSSNRNTTTTALAIINSKTTHSTISAPSTAEPLTEYLVEMTIDTMNKVTLNLLRNRLESLSLPLINSQMNVTEINITSVCLLNGTEYQCMCGDQYLWPCEKCVLYSSCVYMANGSCGCINPIPKDGNTSQPQSSNNTTDIVLDTNTTVMNHIVTFSLKINEDFDLDLVTISSEKYKQYTKTIGNSINIVYSSISAYKTNSATVTGFRPGSVIADFSINATSDNLDLVSANQQVVVSLQEQGFNISNDAFSRTVKDGLYESKSQVYPQNDLSLTCKTTNDSIIWIKDGNELEASNKYIIDKTNKTTLVVKNTTPNDSGVYECRTTENSVPYIIWQGIMIPDPNIQVNISKVVTCKNMTERLQCCVQQSYNVTWITSSSESCSKAVQENGCIYCDYRITENECRASDLQVKITCKLTESDYSKSFNVSAVNKTFACSDNSSNNAFGAGDVDQIKTGDCYGDMIGYQIAQCNALGYWIVTDDNCVTRVIKYLKDRSENLLITDLPEFVQNVSSAAIEKASEITNSSATILTIVDLLKVIADISQTITVSEEIMTDFFKTLDVIGSNDAQDVWVHLNKNSTTMAKSSELLNSTEKIARRLRDGSFNISTNHTSLQKYSNISNSFIGMFGKNSTQINIPTITTQTSLTVIISSVLHNMLPVRKLTYNDNSQTDTKINGDVAVIQTTSTINNISLSFTIKNKTLGNPQCVFWNFSLLNGTGGWDSTGCQLKKLTNESGSYTCECNHTTSFSILMSPFSPNNKALDIITYIGVGISMGSLVLCLIIEFIIWKSVRRNDTSFMRHVSIVNIAVSLLIANICFIIGAAVVTQVGPCSTATFFMHFFYLALFFWMLLSALLLLYRTLMVFSRMTRGAMMSIGFTVGYGAPLIIAVITVASTAGNKGYIQQDYNCWLNWSQTKALLAFVIPALTIVAINLLVLIVVLFKMMKRGVNASIQPNEKHPLLVLARCVAILTPLFGLTWGFGIGTMVSSDFGVHVVFAFLNSLQGFFILVFGTLMDPKVREALSEKLSLTNLSSNNTRSTNAGSSSGGFPFIQKLRKRNAHNISEARDLTTSSSN